MVLGFRASGSGSRGPLAARILTAAGMSSCMTQETIDSLRIELLKLRGVKPREILPKECLWLNFFNPVDESK